MQFSYRYLVVFLVLALTGLYLSGCREDIRMVLPGKPIPVVYGVLDINEADHYLKLSKTFAGETDPFTLSHDRNQVYYTDAQVFISPANRGVKFNFHPVTDNPRSDGSFPAFPNEYFALHQKLDPGNYLLTIVLPGEADTLTASFSFIEDFRIITPKAGFNRVYFYEDPMLFSWTADPSAGLFEINFQMGYEEWLMNGDMRLQTVEFNRQIHPEELETENGRKIYRLFTDSFYARLGTAISKDPSVDYRKPISLELVITAADTILARYLDWFTLEIDEQVNPNGNIKGAIGLVGTKYSIPFPGLILSPRSQDSLVRGKHTKKLDFVANPDW